MNSKIEISVNVNLQLSCDYENRIGYFIINGTIPTYTQLMFKFLVIGLINCSANFIKTSES
jgi:hypothetical protein